MDDAGEHYSLLISANPHKQFTANTPEIGSVIAHERQAISGRGFWFTTLPAERTNGDEADLRKDFVRMAKDVEDSGCRDGADHPVLQIPQKFSGRVFFYDAIQQRVSHSAQLEAIFAGNHFAENDSCRAKFQELMGFRSVHNPGTWQEEHEDHYWLLLRDFEPLEDPLPSVRGGQHSRLLLNFLYKGEPAYTNAVQNPLFVRYRATAIHSMHP